VHNTQWLASKGYVTQQSLAVGKQKHDAGECSYRINLVKKNKRFDDSIAYCGLQLCVTE